MLIENSVDFDSGKKVPTKLIDRDSHAPLMITMTAQQHPDFKLTANEKVKSGVVKTPNDIPDASNEDIFKETPNSMGICGISGTSGLERF